MKLKAKKDTLKIANHSYAISVAKGVLVAVCISLVLVLLFAFLLKFTNIPESTIKPVNQVIKGLSIFIGVFVGLKKSKELGLVSGLLIGLIYTIAAFLIFYRKRTTIISRRSPGPTCASSGNLFSGLPCSLPPCGISF